MLGTHKGTLILTTTHVYVHVNVHRLMHACDKPECMPLNYKIHPDRGAHARGSPLSTAGLNDPAPEFEA